MQIFWQLLHALAESGIITGMALYDITRAVRPTTAVWDNDTAYSAQPLLRMADGYSVNLMTLTTTAHIGTHADATFHYTADGVHPIDMPLTAYIGRARVVTAARRHGLLTPADFAHVDLRGGERLLIHTFVSEAPDDLLVREFPALSVALIELLASLGYVLIGVDAVSVDAYDSKTLDAHHALRRHGIVNLEQITLAGVPDGDYELAALPLKLDLACASPVRAVLRTL